MVKEFEERERQKQEEKEHEEKLIKTIRNTIVEYLRKNDDYRENNTARVLYDQSLQRLLDYFSKKEFAERCFEKAFNQLLKEGIIKEGINKGRFNEKFFYIA
jgi:hypothetical protein